MYLLLTFVTIMKPPNRLFIGLPDYNCNFFKITEAPFMSQNLHGTYWSGDEYKDWSCWRLTVSKLLNIFVQQTFLINKQTSLVYQIIAFDETADRYENYCWKSTNPNP